MIFFAQATTNWEAPAAIGAWLGCLGFILWIVRNGMGFFRDLKDKPTGGEVRAEAHDKFVPKDRFDNHVTENRAAHEQIFSKIGGVERGAKSTVENQVDGVRRDVIKCGQDIAKLNAETQLQNQSLARVENKLDRLIERKS